jgi:hypothetical protein
MEFKSFEEFLDLDLNSNILEQWADDLDLNELLAELEEEDDDDEE